jgi:phage terminase small subunit
LGSGELQDQPETGKRKHKPETGRKKAERLSLFVAEYLIDMNATRAAIRCGYAANSAAVTASRLMKDPWVKAELRRALAQRKKRLKLTAQRFDEEVAKLATSNVYDFGDIRGGDTWDLHDVTRDDAAAVSEIRFETVTVRAAGPPEEQGRLPADQLVTRVKKLKFHSKNQALLLYGKRLKLLKDVEVEHTGKITLVADM